jgi:hypothetical protein
MRPFMYRGRRRIGRVIPPLLPPVALVAPIRVCVHGLIVCDCRAESHLTQPIKLGSSDEYR